MKNRELIIEEERPMTLEEARKTKKILEVCSAVSGLGSAISTSAFVSDMIKNENYEACMTKGMFGILFLGFSYIATKVGNVLEENALEAKVDSKPFQKIKTK